MDKRSYDRRKTEEAGGVCMKSEKEILEAIKEFNEMAYDEFMEKYGTETLREGIGFVKALLWVLGVKAEDVGVEL